MGVDSGMDSGIDSAWLLYAGAEGKARGIMGWRAITLNMG